MSNYIDTRDLIKERNETKSTILDAFNDEFTTDYTDYDEIDFELVDDNKEFQELWKDELNSIREIDELEDNIDNGEFDFGTTLIDEDDFQEYCEDLVSDIGDLPTDLPSYISNNIDWEGVAEDLKVDYSEVEFRGTNYLFR